jgi:uncharacterized protein YlxW (UPF0749 family)
VTDQPDPTEPSPDESLPDEPSEETPDPAAADAASDADAAVEAVAGVDAEKSTVEKVASPTVGQQVRDLVRPRMNAAALVIALLVGLLGFALIAQVHSNNSATTLSSDRPDDLVRILSDLDNRKDRLNAEILSLQETQRELSSGAQSKQAALAAATQRADELGILAGTLPAQGPGLVVELEPTSKTILASDVLDTVEELRGAGAEAMEIAGGNGPTVRIIASTWFVDGNGGIIVDGDQLSGTITITAIGGAQTMQTALNIPGGVVDQVQHDGGTVLVQTPGTVRVTTLAPATTMKYAHPVS